ncbi:alkene reductase [Actinosynnema sp. NPDC047251]|uniref:N-ethylmaleimide reductase n=1 Tax=Saccharothrix espanaensis (strain ATCC 51144 / DSM 44229 / JCM 9112 / NBRC 15066 / NRRL 15764) TaxID=1179773 RepID=K0K5S2_SACES|nr:alkene reductase [Saccharothrix espanaensis]CCH32224.1 N-ethylmaleimide reductase [Saccharothrix espanaensis DSM 44229]
MNALLTPLERGPLPLPNRLVMAPMTRSRARGGQVTALTAEYYAQRATAGLIITEGTQPCVVGQGYIDTPGLHSPEQAAAWRVVTEAVHARGGRIFVQLMHSGRIGHPSLYPDGGLPLAPSAIASGERLYTPDGLLDHPEPREMTSADIARSVDEFVTAARLAVEAGFDGVELHGASGYLIHQFLADNTNRRTDAYGGTVENRIRFAVEVVRAVGDAIGPDRTGIRLSPGSTLNGVRESDTELLYPALVRALVPVSPAYVHISEFGTRDITKLIRADWPGTLILNPHPGSPDPTGADPAAVADGADALRDGVADAISFGQLWLANPDLPERIAAGGPFTGADPTTFYGGDHRGYTDYPTLAGR